MSDELVEINSDDFIPIKATPRGMKHLMNKKVEEKVDQLNAKERHKKNPPKHDTMEDYLRDKVKQRNQVQGGGVVMGNLSEAEREALNSENDGLLRRQQALRAKAMRIMKERHLEGKTQRDYFKGYRGYQELAKRQGKLPNAPKDVSERNQFLEGE